MHTKKPHNKVEKSFDVYLLASNGIDPLLSSWDITYLYLKILISSTFGLPNNLHQKW